VLFMYVLLSYSSAAFSLRLIFNNPQFSAATNLYGFENLLEMNVNFLIIKYEGGTSILAPKILDRF